jgi:hypothetical protein
VAVLSFPPQGAESVIFANHQFCTLTGYSLVHSFFLLVLLLELFP